MSEATAFYPLEVVSVERETRDAVVVAFAPPKATRERFRHKQGQYLTLRAQIDGEEVRRSYSICTPASSDTLKVAIKRVPGGAFSTFANGALEVGMSVEAMPPAGGFYVDVDPQSKRHYLAVAAGSGITPMMSIIQTALETEPGSRVTLIYGNRASASIMFREALEDLKNRFLGRLNLVHLLTREQQDVELFNGRLDEAKCDALFERWVDVASVDHAFVCGPLQMMEAVRASLLAHGVASERVKMELFEAPDQKPSRRRQVSTEKATEGDCAVRIVMAGRSYEFALLRGRETVLEAGERSGLDMPFSCRKGICSTCHARLLEGEVDMDANYALEDYEIARGYILTCQSHPATDRVVIDYDQ